MCCNDLVFFNVVNTLKKKRTLFLVFGALAALNYPKVCEGGEKIAFESNFFLSEGCCSYGKAQLKTKSINNPNLRALFGLYILFTSL